VTGPVDAALVAVFLSLASVYSGLPIPPTHPAPRMTVVDAAVLGKPGVAGLTFPGSFEVELRAGWDPRTAGGYCTAVHEAVHVLQGWNNAAPSCKEPPAFLAEARCFADFGTAEQVQWALDQAAAELRACPRIRKREAAR
jgi:hypothetical protein